MVFLIKITFRVAVNGVLLYYLPRFFSGFSVTENTAALAVAALVITVLSVFVKPVLKFITLPIRFLTLGLFTVVIHVFILWLADFLLTSLTITGFSTLFITSLIFAAVNIIL